MHPDAEAAKTGEYGLCDDIKVLDHFPTMDWWAKESPGRTAIVRCSSWSAATDALGRAGRTDPPGTRGVDPVIRYVPRLK